MMISSLVFALAASAAAAPLPKLIHLHPRATVPDDRISLQLTNENNGFRDVKIAGHTYTVDRHQTLDVKAPAGTVIYVDSRTRTHKRGDVLLEVTPAVDHARISLD